MEQNMSAKEFFEWKVFTAMEPFGEFASFYRTGILASIIVGMFREKGKAPAKAVDFIPFNFGQTETAKRREQSPQEIGAMLRLLAKSTNAKMISKEE
jgi:hypothetical protein